MQIRSDRHQKVSAPDSELPATLFMRQEVYRSGITRLTCLYPILGNKDEGGAEKEGGGREKNMQTSKPSRLKFDLG